MYESVFYDANMEHIRILILLRTCYKNSRRMNGAKLKHILFEDYVNISEKIHKMAHRIYHHLARYNNSVIFEFLN